MNYSLIILAALQKFSFAGDARERCAVEDCLCEVVVNDTYLSEYLEVFFDEGSSRLYPSQIEVIDKWMSKSKTSNYYIWGSADSCGEVKDNLALVDRRIDAVSNYIKVPSYNRFNLGELDGHSSMHRKVVVTRNYLEKGRELIADPTQWYLIDASASMKDEWSEISSFPIPRGSKVYIAKTHNCYNGMPFSHVEPEGKTEIWFPYWKVLSWMSEGDRLTIVSDFNSTVPLSNSGYSIINSLVEKKKIKIRIIKY